MKKKVILLAHEDLYGGGTRQTFYIASQLAQQGAETVIVSNGEKSWLGKAVAESGLPIRMIYLEAIQRAINPLLELQVFCGLIQIFLQERPDVVFASGVKLIGLGGMASWLCRVPGRFAIIRGEGAPPGSHMLRIIYVMERLIALLGIHYITVSEYIRQQMIRHGIAIAEQITTVHDGVDTEVFHVGSAKAQPETGIFTNRFALPPHAFKIGMVGRLVAGKRYDQFIQLLQSVCEQYPNVYGLLIGEGEDRAQLEAQIEVMGLSERIVLAGYCHDMAAVYQDLDLSILLTDYEGCPNSILESMAAQVPVIASDVCGIGEIIQSGQNGFLIAPGELEAALPIVASLIEDSSLRERLGKNAKETVLTSFNLQTQAQKVIQILLRLP